MLRSIYIVKIPEFFFSQGMLRPIKSKLPQFNFLLSVSHEQSYASTEILTLRSLRPMSQQLNFPLSAFPRDQKSFLFPSTSSRFPPLTFLHRRIKHPITNHFKEAHENRTHTRPESFMPCCVRRRLRNTCPVLLQNTSFSRSFSFRHIFYVHHREMNLFFPCFKRRNAFSKFRNIGRDEP